mgnify:CR=1 FL=1
MPLRKFSEIVKLAEKHHGKAGLAIDDFAPRLSFFFNVHNHFLEEIAKVSSREHC